MTEGHDQKMDPADCSALEFEAEMERLVKLLDGIPQSDSLQVMSEELRALEAIVKINPQIQQFATNTILVRTIAAWGGARQGNFTWSLSTPMQQKQLNQRSLQQNRVSAPVSRNSSPSTHPLGPRSPAHSPASFLTAM